MPDLILGAGPSDQVTATLSGAVRAVGPALCTVWDAETGGTQYDVVVAGETVQSFRVGSEGRIPTFHVATDDDVWEVWIEVAGIAGRYRLGVQPGPAGQDGQDGQDGAPGGSDAETAQRIQSGLQTQDALGAELARTGSPAQAALAVAVPSLAQASIASRGLPAGTRLGLIGASTSNGSNSSAASSTSYPAMIQRLAGTAIVQPIYFTGGEEYGYGSKRRTYPGQTSSSIAPHVGELIAAGIDLLMIGCDFAGNDSGAGVPLATVQANYKSVVAAARAAGIPVLVCLNKPRTNADASAVQLTNVYNAWLIRWCGEQGIPVADTYTAIADEFGYLAVPYVSTDSTHPNDAGHEALARAILPVLRTMLAGRPWAPQAQRALNAFPKPGFIDGLGSFVSLSGTPTSFDTVAAAPGELMLGQWARMRYNNSAGTDTVSLARGWDIPPSAASPMGWTVGDLIEVYFKIKTTHIGVGAVRFYRQSAATEQTFLNGPAEANSVIAWRARYTVGATPTALRLGLGMSVPAGIDATVHLGDVSVVNRTRAGLADPAPA